MSVSLRSSFCVSTVLGFDSVLCWWLVEPLHQPTSSNNSLKICFGYSPYICDCTRRPMQMAA
jgi:hypothetical protein